MSWTGISSVLGGADMSGATGSVRGEEGDEDSSDLGGRGKWSRF